MPAWVIVDTDADVPNVWGPFKTWADAKRYLTDDNLDSGDFTHIVELRDPE